MTLINEDNKTIVRVQKLHVKYNDRYIPPRLIPPSKKVS